MVTALVLTLIRVHHDDYLYDQGSTTLWLVIVTEVLLILWFASTAVFSALSKPPVKKKQAYRNETLFVITILCLVVIFEAIGMSGGFEILRNALVHDKRPFPWLQEKTLTIERDSVVVSTTVICWSFVATSISRFGLFSAGAFGARVLWLMLCLLALYMPRFVKNVTFGGDYATTYNEGARYTANVSSGAAEGITFIFLFLVAAQLEVTVERITRIFEAMTKDDAHQGRDKESKEPLIPMMPAAPRPPPPKGPPSQPSQPLRDKELATSSAKSMTVVIC